MRAAEVRIAGEAALRRVRADGDHAATVRRRHVAYLDRFVARRHHDHRALRQRVVDRFLHRLVARAETAQAQVDDLRRGACWAGTPSICTPDAHSMPSRTSSNVPPHWPSTRTGRMSTPPATPAMPTPLLVLAAIMPRHEQAVEEAAVVTRRAIAVAPVALVARVRIARVAVARAIGVGDEVVAGQHAPDEVGVRQDAGVDHRDGHVVRGTAAASHAVSTLTPALAPRSDHCSGEERVVGHGDRAQRAGPDRRIDVGVRLHELGHRGQRARRLVGDRLST